MTDVVPAAAKPTVQSTTTPNAPLRNVVPKKFSGNAMAFKMWQHKLLFYLTTLSLARFIKEDAPKIPEDNIDPILLIAVEVWEHSNFLFQNYILNSIDDSLYNVYSKINSARQLWESLDKKYKSEDVGMKKFVIGRFLDYLTVDSKTVMSQVQELQLILHDILIEGMIASEAFQVATVIEKLPPSWNDFKNYLKHK